MSYHSFLLRNRPFCEEGLCMEPSVYVVKDKSNHDICVCEKHGHPIEYGLKLRETLDTRELSKRGDR